MWKDIVLRRFYGEIYKNFNTISVSGEQNEWIYIRIPDSPRSDAG